METKKSPKLEIGRNSSLYFAIGLNVMLFLSWQALEYKTYDKGVATIDVIDVEKEFEEEIPIVSINVLPPPPPIAIQMAIKIVDDIEEIEETLIESTEAGQDDMVEEHIVDISEVIVEDVEEDVEVPFAVIEDVPVFPGCEGKAKKGTKACFQKKCKNTSLKILSIQI